MEPKIYLLDAITPDTKNWTAKVSVLNKTEPRTSSQPASIRFQKMLFGDKRIEAMLYRGDIDLLRNSLQPHRTYLISNALVRPVKPGFENPLTNNRFQWILGARTAILAAYEDSLISSELSPTFTQCDHFRNFLGSRTLISTAAIIIDNQTPRTVTAKGKQNTLHEYAAVDELLKPFIITFWNDAVPDDVYILLDQAKDRHIIAALNFSVTDYHNISLSSTSASVVLMNSNIERVQALQQGCFMHKREIDEIQQQGNVFKLAQSNFSTDPKTFTSVETFLTTEQRDNKSILCVQGKLPSTNQSFIYPCCAKCHRLTTAEYGCLFECYSCHETRNAIPRYIFSLLIYDSTGEMEVTIFGDEGEKIVQMPASDFLHKYSNARLLTIDSITSNLHHLELKMKVHSKFFNKQDGTSTLTHTVHSLECHQQPSSIITTNQPPSSPISAHNIPIASSADEKSAEILETSQPNTTPLTPSLKDHPRPDSHTSTSSRGRALKTKRAE
ncbi:hypothetical protein OROHE_002425 [Orobanche hederae]